MSLLLLSILIFFSVTSSGTSAESSTLPFGQISHVNVSSGHPARTRYSFTPSDGWMPQQDQMLRVQVGGAGRRGQRPTDLRSVTVTAMLPDGYLQWTIPWRARTPDSGQFDFPSEWRQIISCQPAESGQALQSVQFIARSESPEPLLLQWRADIENVAFGRRVKMRSLVSDISYKHYSWRGGVQEVRIDADTVKGHCVCASLMVADHCTENPYEITRDNHHLVVNFTQSAQFTIQKRNLPKGFYLYLLPQWNHDYCQGKVQRDTNNQHLSKTIEILSTPRGFLSENEEVVVVDEEQNSDQALLCKIH